MLSFSVRGSLSTNLFEQSLITWNLRRTSYIFEFEVSSGKNMSAKIKEHPWEQVYGAFENSSDPNIQLIFPVLLYGTDAWISFIYDLDGPIKE